MCTLVNSLLKQGYSKCLSKVSPKHPVVTPLEHKLNKLSVMVHIESRVENSDHLRAISVVVLQQSGQAR